MDYINLAQDSAKSTALVSKVMRFYVILEMRTVMKLHVP
jgi:hypothetical protein